MQIKTLMLGCALLTLAISACAQNNDAMIGKKFPSIESASLAGNSVSLPEVVSGKITLITIAFLEEGQPFIDSWAEPFLEKYGQNERLAYFEVPMMNIPNPAARKYIDSGMRAGIAESRHPNVVTYYGDFSAYQKELNMPNVRSAYIYLVDQEGIIQFTGAGKMQPSDWNMMMEKINLLLNQ